MILPAATQMGSFDWRPVAGVGSLLISMTDAPMIGLTLASHQNFPGFYQRQSTCVMGKDQEIIATSSKSPPGTSSKSLEKLLNLK
jgi:hypothetical protein